MAGEAGDNGEAEELRPDFVEEFLGFLPAIGLDELGFIVIPVGVEAFGGFDEDFGGQVISVGVKLECAGGRASVEFLQAAVFDYENGGKIPV